MCLNTYPASRLRSIAERGYPSSCAQHRVASRSQERARPERQRFGGVVNLTIPFHLLAGSRSCSPPPSAVGEDMRWPEVRAAHPDQWLVIEALDAHSENDHRIFDRIAVIDVCQDGRATMKRYGELRRQYPHREFCFVHTSVVDLAIEERLWLGVRGLHAADLAV
jgi:hypothetical protein